MKVAALIALVASLCGVDGSKRAADQVRYVPGQLLVKFDEGASSEAIAHALTRVGARSEGEIAGLGVEVVAVQRGRERAVAELLGADPAVERIERDVVVTADATTPNDPFWTAQTGSQEISAPGAWDLTRGSQATVVAVLDSGVDGSHPDLAGSTRPGRDFINDDADASDDNGHGTEAAGVIAARETTRRASPESAGPARCCP